MKNRPTGWLTLALALIVSLAACGTPAQKQPNAPASPSSAVSAPSAPNIENKTPPPESSAPSASQPGPESESKAPESSASEISLPEEESSPQTPKPEISAPEEENTSPENTLTVTEDGWYDQKEEVALYLHLYNRLPGNYVTKKEAQNKGWEGGSVERYTGEGTAIGGDRFGNREGLLPAKKGRSYTECDINTVGKRSRGAERIIFSSDGLVYYTGDHYESFELLYGEP